MRAARTASRDKSAASTRTDFATTLPNVLLESCDVNGGIQAMPANLPHVHLHLSFEDVGCRIGHVPAARHYAIRQRLTRRVQP